MPQNAVEEDDAIVTGAFSGAAAGAATGNPLAILGGAIIGGFLGAKTARSQNRAARKAEAARTEALHKASIFKNIAQRQTKSLTQTGRTLEAATPTKGIKPQAIPTGSTPTAAIGAGIGSSGTF